ncbi:glycosyltransferase family 2 protein [Terribacillus halophilus]|uniref:glycosyltransferase family 2 protein n=1 Tax=Terribacillus halophilus TaxID=361279 RepID=UPI003981F819
MHSISFIVPTYNNFNLLKRCIDSIISQINENDELIIVDDGSTDGTYEKINEAYKISNIKIIRQENSGSGIARNKGIENSNSDYIWFVDADDEIATDSVSKIRDALQENPEIIIFDYIVRSGEGDFVQDLNIDVTDIQQLLLLNHFPWNKVFKRNIFDSLRFPINKIRYQDHATIPNTYSIASKIKYIAHPLYVYDFSHEGNISKDSSKRDHIYIACDYLQKTLPKYQFELVIIKTLILNRMFDKGRTINQIKLDFEKITRYLSDNQVNWKQSQYTRLRFFKKYKKFIPYSYLKWFVITILRKNAKFGLVMLIILMRFRETIKTN